MHRAFRLLGDFSELVTGRAPRPAVAPGHATGWSTCRPSTDGPVLQLCNRTHERAGETLPAQTCQSTVAHPCGTEMRERGNNCNWRSSKFLREQVRHALCQMRNEACDHRFLTA